MAKIRKQLTIGIEENDFTDLPTRRKCKLPFAINAAVHGTSPISLALSPPSPFPFVPSFLLPFRVPGTLYVSHPCLEVIPSFLLPTAISPNNMAAKRSEQSIANERASERANERWAPTGCIIELRLLNAKSNVIFRPFCATHNRGSHALRDRPLSHRLSP